MAKLKTRKFVKKYFFNIKLLHAHLQYVCNISAKCWKDPVKAPRITKRNNSCNTDPSAPIFLSNMHCLMVKVWCKSEQNRTKAIKVTEQNLKCWQKDGIMEFRTCWKQYITLKLCFARGYKNACLKNITNSQLKTPHGEILFYQHASENLHSLYWNIFFF